MAKKNTSTHTHYSSTQKNGKVPLPLPYSAVVLAVDPGNDGAFVLLNSGKGFAFKIMPMVDKEISFGECLKILKASKASHVFLERAYGGQMGSTGAFNYGRGFAKLEIAVQLSGIPVTYVEPTKWTKIMHAGINKKYKAKEKSIMAVKRLFPVQCEKIPKGPKSGKMHEGVVDALLIAGYGLRILKG